MRLHDSRVSKNHAKIFFATGTWVLRDLGSANGTYVNRKKCDGLVELETGDLLQMGRVLIKVLQADAVGMDPMRGLPGNQPKRNEGDVGIDAFTASGATGALPAIDTGKPDKAEADGEIDLASLFDDDNAQDDLLDLSELSKGGASHAGIDAGQTHAIGETIELDADAIEPADPPEPASNYKPAEVVEDDSLCGDAEPEVLADDTPEPEPARDDLIEINDEYVSDDPPTLGTTMLAAIDDDEAQDHDEDQDKPQIVGLRLDQPAPHQPSTEPSPELTVEPAFESELEIETGPEVEAESELEALTLPELDREPGAAAEPVAEQEAEQQAEQQPVPEIEEDLEPAIVEPVGQSLDLNLETEAEAELDDEIDADLDALTPPVEAALTPETIDDDSVDLDSDSFPTQEQSPSAIDTNEQAASQDSLPTPDHDDQPTVDEPAEPITHDEPAAAAETDQPAIEEVQEPLPTPPILRQSARPGDFDIDAAFDALTVGLDDSVQLPAIVDLPAEKSYEEDATAPPAIANVDDAFSQSVAEPQPQVEADASEDEAAADVESPSADEAEAAPVTDEVATPAEIEDQPEPETKSDAEVELLAEIEGQTRNEADAALDSDSDFDIELTLDETSVAQAQSELADADPTQRDEDAPSPEAESALPDPSPLAGSQLDISFIKDALAKLEDELGNDAVVEASLADSSSDFEPVDEAAALEPDAIDSPAALTGSADAVSDELGLHEDELDGAVDAQTLEPEPAVTGAASDELAHDPAIDRSGASPPPGINPTSVLPPSEPIHAYQTEPKRKRRWFFTGLSLLVVVGLGLGLAAMVIFNPPIAGRDDNPDGNGSSNPNQTPRQDSLPGDSGSNTSVNPPNRQPNGKDPLAPELVVPETTNTPDTLAGAAPVPAPFSEGPDVIGGRVLIGITANPLNPDLDDPETTNDPSDNPGSIDPIVSPNPDTPINPFPDITPLDPDAVVPPVPVERIVFLVDASGSLVDSLPQMLVWLNEAVETVGPDEQFAIIFFKAGKAIETDPAGLQTPTREVLDALQVNWLNPEAAPILPTGRSNPVKALEKALSYKPTDMYLLSDESFARFAGDTTRDRAVQLIQDSLGETKVRLHGVQFFYRDEGGVLETLANKYDGTFEFVKEDVVPDADPIDLLEELDRSE